MPAVVPLPEPEPAPYTRRESLRGEPSPTPEPAAMLTAERLIDKRKKRRQAPGGLLAAVPLSRSRSTSSTSATRVRVRERKALDARINKQFEGGTRFIPILTRKGGVGKTTITTLLGMALADVRDDRVIAIDANPDRGTLAERVHKQTRSTVRDVVHRASQINGVHRFLDARLAGRDPARHPRVRHRPAARAGVRRERLQRRRRPGRPVLLDRAHRLRNRHRALGDAGDSRSAPTRSSIVSGGSVDEARLASETLTWLESNGYSDLVRNAVVALNTATHATNLVKLDEIEAHFNSRVRAVVRMPYDPHLAAGSVVNYRDLKPLTLQSARELAALVMDGLPVRRED